MIGFEYVVYFNKIAKTEQYLQYTPNNYIMKKQNFVESMKNGEVNQMVVPPIKKLWGGKNKSC